MQQAGAAARRSLARSIWVQVRQYAPIMQSKNQTDPRGRLNTTSSYYIARANGEGSIYPLQRLRRLRLGGTGPTVRGRKYVCAKTPEEVHGKWLKAHQDAKAGAVATRTGTPGAYLTCWLAG
jgi:hypothetical protein